MTDALASRDAAASAVPLRLVAPEEAARLSAFLGAMFTDAYGDISPRDDTQLHIDTVYAPAKLADELRDPNLRTWVAHAGDAWTGCVQLALREPSPQPLAGEPAAELRRFYVEPAWFGTAVAPTLMRRVQDTAVAAGARAVWLSVWQHAPRAIRFYEKHGFAVVGVAPSFAVGHTLHDDYIMAWYPPAAA